MSKTESPSDYPGFNAAEHRAALAAIEGVKPVPAPSKASFDNSLEKPPAILPEWSAVSEEGHEIFDRIPNLVFRIKEDRKSVKSLYESLSNIAWAFEYKEDRNDAETVFLTEVLQARIKLAGDLNRKDVTKDDAAMPILERIDKAEWLAENGSVLEAEKELITVRTQVSLLELKIQMAYSAIPRKE